MAASKRKGGTGGDAKLLTITQEEVAEDLIQATRKSKETQLDLRGLGLIELPASIGQLAQLQRLSVFNNRLCVAT